MTQSIYLAGPEVFLPNAKALGEEKKRMCARYGFTGHFPLDAEIQATPGSLRETGMRISRENRILIEQCDIVVANMTPFRGPSADAGTVFEIGFACGLGKRVFAYTNRGDSFYERTRDFVGENALARDSGELQDGHHMLLENFGLTDNLMLDGGIEVSGGRLVVRDVPEHEIYTALGGFEECLRLARALG